MRAKSTVTDIICICCPNSELVCVETKIAFVEFTCFINVIKPIKDIDGSFQQRRVSFTTKIQGEYFH